MISEAFNVVTSANSSLLTRVDGMKFERQPEEIEGQLSLVAQFHQGIFLCSEAIMEGCYAQAAALLRQEMETIEAIDEFKNSQRIEKKTP